MPSSRRSLVGPGTAFAFALGATAARAATELTVYTALEADQLKA